MDIELNKDLDHLLNEHFAGRVVRKDLTKLIKEGANVPVYVLEYLLGMYCASDDAEVIEQGLKNVKTVLAENYVRPDEAEKVKSLVRERGTYKVIDRVTVRLNEKKDRYEASFSNLGIKDAEISAGIVKEYEKLLVGGIWVIATLSYYHEEGQNGYSLRRYATEANSDAKHEHAGAIRRPFSADHSAVARNPDPFNRHGALDPGRVSPVAPACAHGSLCREQLQRLRAGATRYRQESYLQGMLTQQHAGIWWPDHSGPTMFYNMSSRRIGLVGLWDVVAFDEDRRDQLQGQRRRADHEGLHGLRILR